MDVQRSMTDVRTAAPAVVKLERRRIVAAGSLPMTDVFVPMPPKARRFFRAAEFLGTRVLVVWLVVLLVGLPISPAFASEADSIQDPESSIQEGAGGGGETSGSTEEVSPPEEDESAPAASTDPRWGLGTSGGGVPITYNEQPATNDEDSGSDGAEVPPPAGGTTSSDPGSQEIPTLGDLEAKLSLEEISALRSEIYTQVQGQLQEQIEAFQQEKQKLQDGCLHYEDGSFFCLDPERTNGPVAPSAGGTGTVYVQKDEAEGDGEIYLAKRGVEANDPSSPAATDGQGANGNANLREEEPVRLTDNINDDQFPAISMDGRSVVWQSQISDRWQIMRRDMATGLVEQLTTTPYNNTNPHAAGDMIVWQGWPSFAKASEGEPNADWEVFVAERSASGWDVRQLTDNGVHDMFPKVAGGFITWQASEGDAWQVYAYDIAQGTTQQLSTGSEKHQNPRVALIWETEESDGSRRILSYDLTTGETAPVGSRPATPNPDDLPQPPLADEDATVPAERTNTEDDAPVDDVE